MTNSYSGCVDFEENCAACGVNDRADGDRYCEGCGRALRR